jgi:hypothetical protein
MIGDSVAGIEFPHLLIQAQLLIPTQPGPRPYFFVAPDILVWSAEHGRYIPGDLKSFVVRENEVDPGDLARVRLQLGAQALALAHEYHRIDPAIDVPPRGLLIFSHPNGLRPHAPRMEDIGGAVHSVQVAIAAFLRHRQKINALRAGGEPYTVAADLVPYFEETCLTTCVMASWCRQRVAEKAADLGDASRDLLGDITFDRLSGLILGTIEPVDEHERAIATELQRIATENGLARVA